MTLRLLVASDQRNIKPAEPGSMFDCVSASPWGTRGLRVTLDLRRSSRPSSAACDVACFPAPRRRSFTTTTSAVRVFCFTVAIPREGSPSRLLRASSDDGGLAQAHNPRRQDWFLRADCHYSHP